MEVVHRSMPLFIPQSVNAARGGEGGHQRWLQHKTLGSGQGVAGLNLPPGNPFRGQVCLLKERQSSHFGVLRGGRPRHSRN